MSDLLQINVNQHTERKNGLTYLSWAWAWAEVLKIDPLAQWEAVEYAQPDGTTLPFIRMPDGTATVKTLVTIKGCARACMLPVMNHRNQAIKNPDAFAINTATMRCLAKAIAMHGLGLYIYAGEDLPEAEQATPAPAPAPAPAPKHSPVPDIDLAPEDRAHVAAVVDSIVLAWQDGQEMDAIAAYYELAGNDHKVAAWKLLAPHAKLRALLKANKPEAQTA